MWTNHSKMVKLNLGGPAVKLTHNYSFERKDLEEIVGGHYVRNW